MKSKLRKKAIIRKKHPTQKINNIIQRRKKIAKNKPHLAEKMSAELIFAKKRGTKYAGTGNATISSTNFSKKFVSTKRLIHTHPNLLINGKLKQSPSPSLTDISTLFNLKLKTSLIAVTEKKASNQVAGYLVMRKTKKSEKITKQIRKNQAKMFKEIKQNKLNNNYWTTFLNKLSKKKYAPYPNQQKIIKLINSIKKEISNISTIQEKYIKTKNTIEYKQKQLLFAQKNDRISQEFFYKELEKLSKEKDLINKKNKSTRIKIEKNINQLIQKEKNAFKQFIINEKFNELGVFDSMKKIENIGLKHSGFFRAAPTKEINKDFFNKLEHNQKVFEDKLGIQFRMVPAKGFVTKNNEFVKKTQ